MPTAMCCSRSPLGELTACMEDILNSEQVDALAAVWVTLPSALGPERIQKEVIDVLRNAQMLERWPMITRIFGQGSDQASEGIQCLLTSDETYDEIIDDQFHLVQGPAKPIAPPWESVYRNENELLFGGATMSVRDFYGRFNLQAPKLNVEPDDHISLELQFCGELLARALNAIEDGAIEKKRFFLQAHNEFCREHLLVWAPDFFSKLTHGAQTNFFRGVGILGSDAMAKLNSVLGTRWAD